MLSNSQSMPGRVIERKRGAAGKAEGISEFLFSDRLMI